VRAVAAAILFLIVATRTAPAADAEAVRRGEYLFHAAGCAGCHTEKTGPGKGDRGPLAAGGRRLKTPFGVFYGPNITPDPVHGIGRWSDADFIRALREGVAPDGRHYYPVFPYASFTLMNEHDMLDLKAYLFSLPPVAKPNVPHEVRFPFGFRFLLGFWKRLYFAPGPFRPDPARDTAWNRGAYLTNALGHCGECHTPRDRLGGLRRDRWLAGTRDGPDGEAVPNLTPDRETGLGAWSAGDIAEVLASGMTRDGDFVGGAMGEVADNTARLAEDDRRAIVVYLRGLPPIHNPVKAKKKGKTARRDPEW
jgi:mono/diheme cytochrome c family protein